MRFPTLAAVFLCGVTVVWMTVGGASEDVTSTSFDQVRSRIESDDFSSLGGELLALRHGASLGRSARSYLTAAGSDPATASGFPAATALGTWLGHVERALRDADPSVRTLQDGLRTIVERVRSDTPPADRDAIARMDAAGLAGRIDRARRPPIDDFMSVLESVALTDVMLSDIETAVARARRRASRARD